MGESSAAEQDYFLEVISLTKAYRNPSLPTQLGRLGEITTLQGGYVPSKKDLSYVSNELTSGLWGGSVSSSELGCALAHFQSYRRLAKSSKLFSIIFEDDACLVSEFPIELLYKELVDQRPAIVLLGRNSFDTPIFSNLNKRTKSIYVDRVPPTGAFAYAVNKAAAEVLYSDFTNFGVRGPADWPLDSADKIVFKYFWPPVAGYVDSCSNVARTYKPSSFKSRTLAFINLMLSRTLSPGVKRTLLRVKITRSVRYIFRVKLLKRAP